MNISVFGLGYVGAVTSACLADLGHKIVGVDVSESKVGSFNAGESPILEPGLGEMLSTARRGGRLEATSNVEDAVSNTIVSIVCVGTPSLENGRLNLDYVRTVTQQLANAIAKKGTTHTILFRSTMLPGSTREIVSRYLAEPVADGNVRVYYCPEFLREGTAIADFRDPSLVVGGTKDGNMDETDGELLGLLGANPEILTWEGAELIKYSCNYLHAVKVAFANEIGRIGKSAGIDSARVMSVVCKDTRLNISSYYMRPGNPFGGSCLPKDVSALRAFARQAGVSAPLLESVLPTNEAHLDSLLSTLVASGCRKILLLGLTFKSGTDDLRGSPMVAVAETLLGRGFDLTIFDPHLDLDQLVGANEQMVARTLPHLSRLMTRDVEEAVQNAELIVAAQKSVKLETLAALVRDDQTILDVNGWRELESLRCHYEGFCW